MELIYYFVINFIGYKYTLALYYLILRLLKLPFSVALCFIIFFDNRNFTFFPNLQPTLSVI